MISALQPAWRALEARAAAWARRRQPPPAATLHLGYRLVYILPTRFGLLYAAFTALTLIIALHYNNSTVFAFDFLLVGLGANAMWLTHRNLLALRLRFEGADPVFAGEEARFRILVENRGRLGRHALELQCDSARPVRLALAPGGSRIVALPLPASRRGRLRPGRFTLRTEYPLGLFRAWSWVELDMETLVWPQPLGAGDVPVGQSDAGHANATETRSGEEEFSSIRAYRRGDAMHRLAWKAMARLQEPYTKEFSTPAGQDVWIDWSALPPCPVEERLSRLCAWVLEAASAHVEYGLRIPGVQIAPGSGPAHQYRCLKALALFGSEGA